MNQQGRGNLYDSSTSDLCTSSTPAGTPATSSSPGSRSATRWAYSPTNYHIPLDYMGTTWKCKLEAGEQPTQRKRTLNSKKQFEEALQKRCPWHLKSKHST
jgi:hypothetical protein